MSEAPDTAAADADRTTGANGATAPAPLTPYQKRKQREADEAKARADRKARRDAKAAAATKAEEADEQAAPKLDERKAVRVLGVFVRFLRILANLACWPFGYAVSPLSQEEVQEQADALLPYAVAAPWLYRVALFIGWPALFLDAIARHVRPRKPKGEEAKPS